MSLQSSRLISLDALRGFTIAAMIMVNFPGNEQYVFFTLRHSKWNGLSFTDTIAPIFLFVIGVSVVFAYTRRLNSGVAKGSLYKKIIFRSFKIFSVGMFLNLMPDFDFSEIRWTGTLHRIAIVFMVCAILFLNTGWKQQAWIAVVLLVAYWLALTLIPTPGVGKVMLEPGVNIVAWVDSKCLPGKMWQGTWDPESILSTIPSVVSGITGMLAGRLMISKFTPNEKVNLLMTAGLFSAIAGYFWGLTFPVNENLWTSSFVLVTSGLGALLLGAMYFIVDIQGHQKGVRTGVVFGANAIAVYVLADVLALFFYRLEFGRLPLNEQVVNQLVQTGMLPELASWLYALFFVAVNFVPAYILYRKKIFIKL
ncbi:heparan-alpha-glucosaminide N-acetyltransferase domain-containing protein [Agriterribacter sp.]|uniref:acyltransferase family protein n=1 Tax=Agriterribacter sp. TaxID=2821509 RepID=UPI002BB40B3B|nr:heparan-alpha-glucosaminide N-acetyltransferase domain-containing protein [Agriterribacter sp.]HRP57520.1 heparan-alpha-glucosaminide N-acetyltransferase domain-containing protein [Agriterribacter sp.]